MFCASIFATAIRASLQLGHWPRYPHDDPSLLEDRLGDALYSTLDQASSALGLLAFLGIPLFVAFWGFVLPERVGSRARVWTAVFFAFGWALFCLEPTTTVEWWLD